MATEIQFSKMHGLGNCFILVDDRSTGYAASDTRESLARRVCDRNFGIGADGLILVGGSQIADFRMTILNEDGTEAEMCGNGIRCFARFVVDRGMTDRESLSIETPAGVMKTQLKTDGLVQVDMGTPSFSGRDVADHKPGDDGLIHVESNGHGFSFVSMGNPHAVTFVDGYDFDWRKCGAAVEKDPAFANHVNVEFIDVHGKNEITMKVWERGCGETMACGTGACASVVAGVMRGELDREPATVHLPGGDLLVEWNAEGRVLMTGPGVTTCRGEYLLKS